MRKYLNYNEEARSQVQITDIQLAVREDADRVARGYMSVLHILYLMGKLLVMLYFTASANPGAACYPSGP